MASATHWHCGGLDLAKALPDGSPSDGMWRLRSVLLWATHHAPSRSLCRNRFRQSVGHADQARATEIGRDDSLRWVLIFRLDVGRPMGRSLRRRWHGVSESNRHGGSASVIAFVANQQPDALRKQQRGF
jgi:hypothetical protein